MSIENLIVNFGYPAIFIGTFLEGESVLIIAGFLTHQGYFSIIPVLLLSLLGGFLGDQLIFYLGRSNSDKIIKRSPQWTEKIEKVKKIMEKHQILLIFSMRFLYGFRYIIPFTIGMSKISAKKYIILNFLSAITWSISVFFVGYLFGQTIDLLLADFKKYEIKILLLLLLVIMVALLFKLISARISKRQ